MVNDGAYRTPGQFIEALLEAKGWTQVVLAVVLGIDRAIINKVVADKRPVDAQLALALGEVFGVPPQKLL
jgi:HTH-type transcriptional regulator/antitoxin HigA